MSRSISNYSKLKTTEFEKGKSNKKKVSSKKNRNLTKWGKRKTLDNENSTDSFVLNSPNGNRNEDNNEFTFRPWE